MELNELFFAFTGVLERGEWAAAASLCDPASLAAFKRGLLERVSPTRAETTMTVEQYLKFQPDMPREVAEYQVAEMRRAAASNRVLEDELPGVASAEALRALTPAEVYAAWLEGGSYERQLERSIRSARVPDAVLEELRSQPRPRRTYRVLGSVRDGERLAFILYREEFEYDVTLRREPDPEMAAYLAALTPEERELANDPPPFIQHAAARRQPDGSWKLLADHQMPGRDGMMAISWGED